MSVKIIVGLLTAILITAVAGLAYVWVTGGGGKFMENLGRRLCETKGGVMQEAKCDFIKCKFECVLKQSHDGRFYI